MRVSLPRRRKAHPPQSSFELQQTLTLHSAHPGEELRHHQGGATGYAEREWLATPAGTERVVNNQAFAWNPSVAGGKAEDTVLLRNGNIELLTPTPDLPVVSTSAGEHAVESAGVLVR